jgi:hypothetical protein
MKREIFRAMMKMLKKKDFLFSSRLSLSCIIFHHEKKNELMNYFDLFFSEFLARHPHSRLVPSLSGRFEVKSLLVKRPSHESRNWKSGKLESNFCRQLFVTHSAAGWWF